MVDSKPMVDGLKLFGDHVLETFWRFFQNEVLHPLHLRHTLNLIVLIFYFSSHWRIPWPTRCKSNATITNASWRVTRESSSAVLNSSIAFALSLPGIRTLPLPLWASPALERPHSFHTLPTNFTNNTKVHRPCLKTDTSHRVPNPLPSSSSYLSL